MSATSSSASIGPVKARLHRFPRKYVVDLALCVLLALLGVGLLIRHQYHDTIEEWRNRLSSIADGEELYIKTWVFERNGDLAVLATRPLLATTLLPNLSKADRRRVGEAQPLLDKVVAAYDYSAIYLVDRAGTIRVSSTGAPALPRTIVETSQNFTQSTFEVLPDDLANQLGARMTLTKPIREGVPHGDLREDAGEVLGRVIILTRADLIYSLPSLGTASTRTGESILIRREGNGAVFLSSLRHLMSIPPERRGSLRPPRFAASSILEGRSGFGQFEDYRGVRVLGVTRLIPGVGWGLVAKIDRSEALENFYPLAGLELAATAIVLFVLVAIAFKSARDRQVQDLQEEITRREQAEEELRLSHEDLRLSEERFSSAFEYAPIGLGLVSPEGRWIKVNQSLCDLLGYSADELQKKTFQDITHPEDLEADLEYVRQMLAGEIRSYRMEKRYFHKSGRIVWISLSVSLVRDDRGEPLHFISQIEDITARKHAEEAIRKLNEELEQRVAQRTAELQASNQELEAFSYSVSHDLRAPLRSINGFSRILMEEYAPQLIGEAQRYLQVVRKNAIHMGELIDDLLAFSRLGRQNLRRQTVAPADLVRQALEELHPELEGRQVELNVAELPACQADPALLRQVFVNLFSNALKYSRPRSVARIEVGALSGSDLNREMKSATWPDGIGPSSTVYYVRDNGVGFDMQYAGQLFGVFQRLHRPEEFEGTGVGLAIVKRIIHKHGGQVWAEAEPQKGAAFYFTVQEDSSGAPEDSCVSTEVA